MAVASVADFKTFATSENFISEVSELMVQNIGDDESLGWLNVVPNAVNNQPIAIVDQLDKVTKTDAGCGDNSQAVSVGGFQQKWNMSDLSMHVKWCWSDFVGTFISKGYNVGMEKGDLSSGGMGQFLEDLANRAVIRDFKRLALMGNSSAALQSGGGYFANTGVDVADYNQIERGLVPTLGYLSTITRFQKNFMYIPQNEITGKQYQFDGADGTKKVSDIAFDLEDLAIDFDPSFQLCNHKMIQKGFKRELRDSGVFATDQTRDMLTGGLDVTNVNGYQTYTSKIYDKYISDTVGTFTGNAAGDYNDPNFFIMSSAGNLQMGMDAESAITDLRWIYDDIKDEVHLKCKYRADFKVANPDQLLAAYSYNPNA